MGGRESFDVEELVREIENLREQREAATRLCHGEHGQLYLAEGDVFLIVSQIADMAEGYDYAKEHPHLRDRTTVVRRTALAGEAVQIPDVGPPFLDGHRYPFRYRCPIPWHAGLGDVG